MENANPIKPVENRRPDGTFGAGNIANPNGRPKGKTIKERVREWLEENPDDMKAFVNHFVKNNRDLAWQMLEGRPHQATDITTQGQPLIIPASLINKNDSPSVTGSDSAGQTQV